MPSTQRGHLLGTARVVLVVGGVGFAVATVLALASMEPAPPDSEGFVTGLAYVFGSVIVVLAVGAAGLGVALPSIVGADDSLGFTGGQRVLLKAAGVLGAGGFLLGLAVGLASELQFGFLLWLVTIVLGVLVVCLAVFWRLAEAIVHGLAQVATGDT